MLRPVENIQLFKRIIIHTCHFIVGMSSINVTVRHCAVSAMSQAPRPMDVVLNFITLSPVCEVPQPFKLHTINLRQHGRYTPFVK